MTKTSKNSTSPLQKLKLELAKTKLDIKAGKIKNTNAHKKTKLEIARLLTNKQS
jgi:ribosomal protein L29